MRLTAFKLGHKAPVIRPATPSREWMDATRERFAYRCLPLTMANTHGWELLCPSSFEAHWTGGANLADLTITPSGDEGATPPDWAISHFGAGVLTFHTGYLFRTDPDYNLFVCGPVNRPKDGAVALTGVVETDWLPQPFTMNWLITAPGGPLVFEAGEPFCHVFPIPRDLVERVEPEIRELASEPELQRQHEEWATSRATFNEELRAEGSAARDEKWQKHYARGRHPGGERGAADHRTKLRLREFVERPSR